MSPITPTPSAYPLCKKRSSFQPSPQTLPPQFDLASTSQKFYRLRAAAHAFKRTFILWRLCLVQVKSISAGEIKWEKCGYCLGQRRVEIRSALLSGDWLLTLIAKFGCYGSWDSVTGSEFLVFCLRLFPLSELENIDHYSEPSIILLILLGKLPNSKPTL